MTMVHSTVCGIALLQLETLEIPIITPTSACEFERIPATAFIDACTGALQVGLE